MEIIANWTVDKEQIEILHENGRSDEEGRWEYRVDGEIRMYGHGTPDSARQAVSTRRKLRY
jgi:hypothetical protein